MALTLVQLQTFARLASLGNFTRTAEELDLSQSAVTQQVQSLAAHFGTPLFDLVGRRPVLTDAGRFLAERSVEVAQGIDLLERDMREYAAARTGTLALGATVTIGNYALPQQLARFKQLSGRGDLDVRLTVANTTEICRAVRTHGVALALVEGRVDDEELAAVPYAEDRLTLIVPARGHRFSTRRAVALAELEGEKFVAREPGSGTQLLARDVLRGGGIEAPPVLELPSNEGVLRAVEAGLGVALLSTLAVERDVRAGLVRAVTLRNADLRRSFQIVSLRSRTLSPIALRFVDFIRGDSASG